MPDITPPRAAPKPVKPRAVLITPDRVLRDSLAEHLSTRLTLDAYGTCAEGREAAMSPKTDLVIVAETCTAPSDGFELLMELRELHPERGTILIASVLSAGVQSRAESVGVNRIVIPPLTPAIGPVVANALEHRRLFLQNEDNEAVIARLRTDNLQLKMNEAELMNRISSTEKALAAAEARLAERDGEKPAESSP